MDDKLKAVFIIVAFSLVTADRNNRLINCREMIYARYCRGVALKRGGIETMETNLSPPQDDPRSKEGIYNLSYATETPPLNNGHKDATRISRILYNALLNNRRRNLDDFDSVSFHN